MRRYWGIARALVSPRRSYPAHLSGRQWQRWTNTEATTTPDLTPAAFALRDYQEECIQAVLDHHEQGHRRLGISLATGSGKTVIFTQLIDRIKPLRPNATKTLILVHRRELVEQAATHCRNNYPEKIVEIEMGSQHASGDADITVASIQSIVSGDRIAKFNPKQFKLVLIDEAHHAVAKSYMKTLGHFGATTPESDVYLVGVSATFARSDGLRLGAVMDHIVYHKDFVSMIDSGWLSKVLFTTVKTNIELSAIRHMGVTGDFNLGELSTVVNTPENNEVTVRSWVEKAGNRKSTLVFCVDIAHVTALTNTFRRHGYEAFFVTGETPLKERTQLLLDFKAGKFPVLVNCGVFTEGTDIPNIDCVLLSRPTRSRTLLIQMIGRGMRLHPSKEDCHIIDVVGSIDKGVVTTPTLFGLPPDEVLDRSPSEIVKNKYELFKEAENSTSSAPGATANKGAELSVEEEIDPEIYARPWSVTFVDYDSIHDLLQDKKAEWGVRGFSHNSWVWVRPGKYVLNTQGTGYISVIAKAEGGFYSTETRAMPKELMEKHDTKVPLMRPRTLIEHANSLEEVINGADTFAKRYPRALLRLDSPWRGAPATDGQLLFLSKKSKKTVEEYKQEGLTKGQAADMLTRLKHGAMMLLKDLQAKKRKETKKELKAAKISTPIMETIKVGRLTPDLDLPLGEPEIKLNETST
ncbi:hypothetical protein ABW20_dc0110390 [Dactylellina cionopaga]|nr:hypothetical protein ABW20_dc0110390 [Dactylellina cionopaga]